MTTIDSPDKTSTLLAAMKYLLVVILFFLQPIFADADTYYCNNSTSSTDWNAAQNINTPCTLATALSDAVAGDTVYFRGGIYDIPYQDASSWDGLISPSNGGTEGNPIVLIAYPDETPVFNVSGDWGADDFVMCFATGEGHDYITLDGFTIQGASGTKATGAAIMGNGTPNSVGCIFKNLTINGGTNIITSTNNREGIRIDDSNGTLVQNCYIYNFRQTDDWANTAAIKLYHNNNVTIENCETYNCSTHIFPKRNNHNCIFRYNYLHYGLQGYRMSMVTEAQTWNSNNNKFYHNVIADMPYVAFRCDAQDIAYSNNIEIYQNTVYNCKYGVIAGTGTGWKIYNNIFIAQDIANYKHGCLRDSAVVTQWDHNQYGNSPTLTLIKNWEGADPDTYSTINTWQGSGVCADVGQGSLISTINTIFLNTSGNMTELNDFYLASESPCKDTGFGGVDMGANVTLVGVDATGGNGGNGNGESSTGSVFPNMTILGGKILR